MVVCHFLVLWLERASFSWGFCLCLMVCLGCQFLQYPALGSEATRKPRELTSVLFLGSQGPQQFYSFLSPFRVVLRIFYVYHRGFLGAPMRNREKYICSIFPRVCLMLRSILKYELFSDLVSYLHPSHPSPSYPRNPIWISRFFGKIRSSGSTGFEYSQCLFPIKSSNCGHC